MKSLLLLLSFVLPINGNKTIYNHFTTKNKEVALTFDDGPNINTLKVLEVLDRYHIKATFFMLGENVERCSSIVKKVQESGHSIGLHSYSHPNFHQLNHDKIKDEIIRNQRIIYKNTYYTPTIIRPPYGIITNDFLSVATQLQLTIYTWSNDTFDWKSGNDSMTIVNNGLKKLHPGSIILMHDNSKNHTNSLRALPILIQRIQKEGYKFITLKDEKK